MPARSCSLPRRPGRSRVRWRGEVGAEAVEVAAEPGKLGGTEPGAQLLVEGEDRVEELEEEGPTVIGELDELAATVLGRSVAGDEPGGFELVEVVGERGAFDADRRRDVPLHGVVSAHQRRDDEPRGQRAARGHQMVIELAAQEAAGATEIKADRFGVFCHRITLYRLCLDIESFDI
jgi:hypothetical protein